MDNERPMRLYRHKKKLYYKNGLGGKHLISVPNGMSNVSGSAGKDLYNINIMYGDKKKVKGRSKKKKPEIPLLTAPITENTEPIVVQKYSKQVLGAVDTEKPIPTYISRNAIESKKEVPSKIEDLPKQEIPVDHNMPSTIEDDDIPELIEHITPPRNSPGKRLKDDGWVRPEIEHFNLPTKYDEERDIESYNRLPDPYIQTEDNPLTSENKTLTSEDNPLTSENKTPIWKKVFDYVEKLTVPEIKQKLKTEGFERSTSKLLRSEISQVLINRIIKKHNSGDSDTIEQFGAGKKPKEALTNIDIENIFKKYDGKIVPVVASDMILSLLPQVNTKTKQFYFVMNVAPHKSNGKKDGHWIAWCLDNERKTLYYYNSLARPAKSRWLKDIKTLIKKMDPVHMWKYKYNAIRNQSFKTSDCGYFASHFIHTMMEGGSFSEATFYNHKSLQAERDLKPFIKKWGYI